MKKRSKNSVSDDELSRLMRQLAKKKGFAPLTAAEAEKAFAEAQPVPMNEDEINRIVNCVTQLVPLPSHVGYWVEYIASKPRRIVEILSLNQPFPIGSWWYPIPDINEKPCHKSTTNTGS